MAWSSLIPPAFVAEGLFPPTRLDAALMSSMERCSVLCIINSSKLGISLGGSKPSDPIFSRYALSSSSERASWKWSFRSNVSARIFGSDFATTTRRAFRGAAFSPGDRTVRIENRPWRACLEGQIKNIVAGRMTKGGLDRERPTTRSRRFPSPRRAGASVPERRKSFQTSDIGECEPMNCGAHAVFRIDEIRFERSTAFPSSAKLSRSVGGSASPVHMAVPRWGAQTSRLSTT
jgi:hypothetical protein